ncbi:MAG: hypothetical protein K2K81_08145 [Muribaculaceae bacterium]|nr:hypothetical protein [Muribaculaceae bacterium]
MKKIFILVFALTFLTKVRGEEQYLPILEEGKKWIIETRCDDDPEFIPFLTEITYQDEEIIDGERIVTLVSLDQTEYATPSSHLLKEKNRKLYVWNQIYDTWLLYLDFSCNKGEETDFNKSLTNGFYVNDEGYSLMHGYNRKWLRLSSDYWIEGIGSTTLNHLFYEPIPACFDAPLPNSYLILECYKKDQLLYNLEDYTKLSSVNEYKTFYLNNSCIFDLHGREVSNPLPGSIYIRNGKKFVEK